MGKINLDFQIYDSNDPKQIIILDASYWAHIVDKPAILEVKIPGDEDIVTLFFDKARVTILNSLNLRLNCVTCTSAETIDLPDGVYEITLKGSPDKFRKTKLYLKTTSLQGKLDDMIVKAYDPKHGYCSESSINPEIEKLLRYQNLIRVAESLVRQGYKCEAQEIIFKIHDFLKKYKNCKKCPHNR